MSEAKRVYRIPPCPRFDIAGTESWLEDMAAKGYILEKDSFLFDTATFAVGAPQAIRYRLEATGTNGGILSHEYDPDADAVTLNQEMGWEYRSRRGQFHIYACSDPNAPEMHTDPRIQAISMKGLTKYLWSNLFYVIAEALLYYFAWYEHSLLTFAVYMGAGVTVPLLGVLLSYLIGHIRHLALISRLRHNLQSGQRIEHRSDYRTHQARYYILRFLRPILCVVLFFAIGLRLGAGITGENSVALKDYTGDLPFASVAELFPEAEVEPESGFISSEVTQWSNSIAPESCEYTEYASVHLPDGEHITGYLYVNYYDCRFDWFARALAEEFSGQSQGTFLDRFFEEFPELTYLSIPGFDYAVTYTDHYPHLIVCKGNTVLKVRYHPEMTPYYTPEELAQALLGSIT